MSFLIRGKRQFQAHETTRFDELSGLPLASFRRRLFAFGIDSAIVAAGQIPLVHALEGLRSHVVHHGHVTMEVHPPSEHMIEVLVTLLYFGLLLWWGKGQTPGKRLLRIRVLSLTQDHVGLWQSMERALGYGASALEGGFGFLQFWTDRNRQTVHDRIAETIVVDARKGRPE